MKTIEQMLRQLARTEVAEFAIASGRLPCVKVGGAYQPVDDTAPSTDAILQMLVAAGGSRYVDSLGAKPTQWTMRLDGVGQIAVAAVMREDKVQARFVVARRETAAEAKPAPAPAAPVPAVTKTASAARAPAPRMEFEIELDRPAPARAPAPAPAPAPSPAPSPATAGFAGRELDFGDEQERPTRPGLLTTAGIDLDLERAAAQVEVPRGTERDFEFDVDGKRPDSSKSPVTTRVSTSGSVMLDELIGAARAAGASDLHVVAERPLLLRLCGELVPRGEPLDAGSVEAALMAKVPVRLRPVLENEGSCDFALEHTIHGRFRVNVTRQRTGLKGCFRAIPFAIPTLESLGLPAEIGNATRHHQGLIVVTGPTGHGKTSTLAAIVDIINSGTTHHIITVEDPVEYVHPRKKAMISQREVGSHTMSFQNALKASLREDPDVIVVGELRDTETVRMALSASETGHLVLGTMNTPSAAKTIDRLVDLFPPADQQQVRMTLAGGLRLIVSQRLLPAADGRTMVAAAELLPGSVPLWSLIRDNKTFQIPSLQQRGKGLGIIRLDDSLAELARAHRITRDAAMAVADNPQELEQLLARPAGVPAIEAPRAPQPQAAGGGILQRAGSLFGGKK